MTFKVTKQFGNSREIPSTTQLQQFKDLESAKKHALEGAEENARMKIDAVYRVYDLYNDVVATYNTKSLPANPGASDEENNAQGGQAQGATTKPTPFSTAPRPPGMPANWAVDPDADKNNKDK